MPKGFKGFQPKQIANPLGRPKGNSANKEIMLLRENMIELIKNVNGTMIEDFRAIERPEVRLRLIIDMYRHLIPKPVEVQMTSTNDIYVDFFQKFKAAAEDVIEQK